VEPHPVRRWDAEFERGTAPAPSALEGDLGWTPFSAFVAARSGALLSYAHLLTGDRAGAEDLLQTALARTLLAWPGVRDKDDPEGYVRRTMARLQANVWRSRRRNPEDPVAAVPEPSGPDLAVQLDERDAMWAALGELPPRQRAVLVLRYYEDLSEAEIARVLGCTRGTVKSQAAKALRHLAGVIAVTDDRTTDGGRR
jgi:RNA polymerase sigma-70 factor (sigma-E family)